MTDDGRHRELVTRMTRAWRDLRRGPSTMALRDVLFGTGDDAVEPTHMDVLDLLVEHETLRMSDIAAALKVDPSTVTRTLQRMEAVSLAERSQTTEDGRVVTVTMTDEGRRRHARVDEMRMTMIGRVLDAFSQDEQAQLVELNERLVVSLDEVVGSLPRRGPDV